MKHKGGSSLKTETRRTIELYLATTPVMQVCRGSFIWGNVREGIFKSSVRGAERGFV